MAIQATDFLLPTQRYSAVNAQLGFTLTLTPYVSSGLPTTVLDITDILIAEPMTAEVYEPENASLLQGMNGALMAMAKTKRNIYKMPVKMVGALPDKSSVYDTVNLFSNSNSLIMNNLKFMSGSGITGGCIAGVNAFLFDRPAWLGVVGGATEMDQVVQEASFMFSMDYNATQTGGAVSSILGFVDTLLQGAGNLVP